MSYHNSVHNEMETHYPATLEVTCMNASLLILVVVFFISMAKRILKSFGPKITDFNLILVAVGPNILIGLEIAVETYFPLTFLTIEKFANETHSIIKIPNPEIDTQNKTIKVLNECCFCESIVSYQVTVENIFKKDLSEKIHIYLFQAPFTESFRTDRHKYLSSGAGENRQSDAKLNRNRSYQDKTSLKHIGTQTMFTSLKKYDDPAKLSGRYRRSKRGSEFTYVNLDPEQCMRCLNFGFAKCSLCSAPYCSPRCKSKDFREHRNQCPERRSEEKRRQEKDQEYEIRIKSLHEDIERLRDYGLCKICLEEEARVVFDPCGHLCCCDGCSKQLKACPMCRDDVPKSIKVFT